MEKIKIEVKDSTVYDSCSDGQLRHGKGNRNDEC